MLEVSWTGRSPSVVTVVHTGFFLSQIHFKPAQKDASESEGTRVEAQRPMLSGMDVLAMD